MQARRVHYLLQQQQQLLIDPHSWQIVRLLPSAQRKQFVADKQIEMPAADYFPVAYRN